jgi:RNA polymerase sigma-70 factor (ECF subfamily)
MTDDQSDRVLDGYLVVLAQSGSREAFDRLVRRWTPKLMRFSVRKLGSPNFAGDIVQETWMAAIKGLRRLDDASLFPAWLYRIAHRKCVDAIRDIQRRRRLIARVQAEPETRLDSVNHSMTCDRMGVTDAIQQLTEEQRDVVQLFYSEELSVADIALVLGVPSGTVKSRLHHARESLKKQLGE